MSGRSVNDRPGSGNFRASAVIAGTYALEPDRPVGRPAVPTEKEAIMTTDNLWTIVLAAGDGTRLSGLTLDADGASVPKQYWTIDGATTMLEWTLERAARLTPNRRIVPVVAAAHRRHWEGALPGIPAGNVLVQPENRGTAAGILLPLLHVLRQDRDATVTVMPSDHFVADEPLLEATLRRVVAAVDDTPERVVLVGVEPESADTGLGYLVPRMNRGVGPVDAHGVRPLMGFVEKPSLPHARALIARGAAWNSFIMVARVRTLWNLFDCRQPELLDAFLPLLGRAADAAGLAALYAELPTIDFSRDVLQKSAALLSMIVAPACGWSDLGTPQRVMAWREAFRKPRPTVPVSPARPPMPPAATTVRFAPAAP
jgi:mannose-1-phosphate guanylyltransferase